MNRTEVVGNLRSASAAKSADQLEEAVLAAFESGLFPELGPIFADLLAESWHTKHEDLVSALQQLKEPRAVGALEAAAHREFEYLAYDEFYGLARKCTWGVGGHWFA